MSRAASDQNLPAVREMEFKNDYGVLDAIGTMSPNDWYWNGKGYYDNRPGSWSSFPGKEMLSYDEFRRRLPIAAKENSECQEATRLSTAAMEKARDRENCFRIVELGIPACDVVIVGKPRLEYSKNGEPLIVLGEPDQPASYD